jgi:protein-tyrosine phosphatase|tara:strand:+ start:177 stop:863 length:687 start_codon:yes stop_codon:yes gene_type:complete
MISQSNYIPWKGYFDNIAKVDEFIIYDDMQYTKRDWRNRNKIKTPQGLKWMSIPVEVKGKFFQKISETKISDTSWCKNHLALLKQNYSRAPFYNKEISFVEELYFTSFDLETISEINYHFISNICNYLNINTKISFSNDYPLLEEGKTERLIELCKQVKAKVYYTGSAAKNYIDPALFEIENIDLQYFDYSGYKEYNQLFGDFEHSVSILDLIFNEGSNAKKYLKSYI